MKVNLEDIERYFAWRDTVNRMSLADIEWLRNGEPVTVTAVQLDEWSFVGLSNLAFAETLLEDAPC